MNPLRGQTEGATIDERRQRGDGHDVTFAVDDAAHLRIDADLLEPGAGLRIQLAQTIDAHRNSRKGMPELVPRDDQKLGRICEVSSTRRTAAHR